jgi:hypothetical protein
LEFHGFALSDFSGFGHEFDFHGLRTTRCDVSTPSTPFQTGNGLGVTGKVKLI